MSREPKTGYEAPVTTRGQDDLDRWYFALTILNLIANTTMNWSVRVGIYGKWGEGKTSVLKFIDDMATEKGHVVVWFNPWAIQDLNQMWESFAENLIEQLEKANISIEGFSKWKIKFNKHKKKAKEVLSNASKLPILGQYIEYAEDISGGFSLIENILKIDGETIKSIKSKLGKLRVIVIIDDLDRTDPRLIPNLLLSLREILDIPHFSFILAFDNEIIATALAKHHPAWGTGDEFLHKIIDFPFDLPHITEIQQKKMLIREMNEYCSFVDSSAIENVFDLLPNNPRKLKLLVRQLSVLENEVNRHDYDELDWISIILAQLIKMESESFLRLLLNNSISDEEGVNWSFLGFRSDKEEHQQQIDNDINLLLKKLNIKDNEKKLRLKKLVNAWGVRSGMHKMGHFRYQTNLSIKPSDLTWKEFREVFTLWKNYKDPKKMSKWVSKHAKKHNLSPIEVSKELFRKATLYRRQKLDIAADTAIEEKRNEEMKEASEVLSLLQLLFIDGLELIDKDIYSSPHNFEKLFQMVGQWLHFNKTPVDIEARREENDFIMKCANNVSSNPELYMEILKPWSTLPDNIEYKKLRETIVGIFEPKLSEQAILLFEVNGGITRLFEYGRKISFKYILFGTESSLWKEPLLSNFYNMLRKANINTTVHENCIDYFHLLVEACDNKIETADNKIVNKLIKMDGFIETLWQSVTARRIYFRFLSSYREERGKLISYGVDDAKMPLPDWMINEIHV